MAPRIRNRIKRPFGVFRAAIALRLVELAQKAVFQMLGALFAFAVLPIHILAKRKIIPMSLTSQQIQAGTGATAARAAAWQPYLHPACAMFSIDTPKRLAAFLAQIGHESGRLVYVREIWGPTAAQSRYEGRLDLGNIYPGDGKRYMGRGLIQTTGRANYRSTRDGLRQLLMSVPDFEASPAELEHPEWAAMSAVWYWYSRNLNALADIGDFKTITLKINGGLNGYEDRQALYEAALWALL